MARPNFVEKSFAGGSQTAKFMKVFSLESFPLYSNHVKLYNHDYISTLKNNLNCESECPKHNFLYTLRTILL